MAYVTIYGTTSTPCACCGALESCSFEAEYTVETGCAVDGTCNPIEYPHPGSGPTAYTEIPCPCSEPDAIYQVTGSVRGVGAGLTIGVTYKLTVYLQKVGDPVPTDSYYWTFEATATTETTGWVALPNPSSLGDPGWEPVSCTIEIVP